MTITSNDPNIVYSPGNWDINGTRAKTIYPGAYLRFACTASSSIVLSFDTSGISGTMPHVKWRIDGTGWTRIPVAATVTIPLPSENTWTRHVVEVVVVSVDEYQPRWSSQAQHVSLTSINATASRTLPARPLKVLLFGDSISAGHLAAKYDLGVNGGDASVAFPLVAGNLAGMEVGVVGIGGQGYNSTAPSGVPKLLDAYRYHWQGSGLRDLSADLYVVAMGTNDSGLAQSTVTAWLADALPRFTPGSPVLLMRPFTGSNASAISGAAAAAGVEYVDTAGWWDTADATEPIHPTGYASIVDLGPKLADRMVAALSTGDSSVPTDLFLNVGGEALGIAGVTLNV